ncbi:hypothetical protein K7432_001420 [Basidiobolus ranarum]|uniref:Rho-GAP domain-containing protein n=1 Tax=Basidiobolus ranarum TaxID=34480 RepID=A0ABR2X3F2_9FUNG
MENVPEKLALVAECLPEPNYYLLHWLMSHLARLDFYNAENKMTVSNLGLIFCPTLLISSVLFTAFVNHVGVVFPLPRKSSSRVSNAAPSSPAFVSRNPKRSSRQFPLNKPMDISSIWPPGTPSTQCQGNPESSKAFESDSSALAPTRDLIDLSSANTTALDGVSSNSESISEDKAKDPAGHMNITHTNDNKPATPSRTPSLGPNGKDDSGLISIDIDGNGLHMGVLNLNIRRSPAARGSHLPNMVSPIPNSKALNVTNSSDNLSPQNPALPPRPARLTRKLTPRTTTKYVKDMLEFVDH